MSINACSFIMLTETRMAGNSRAVVDAPVLQSFLSHPNNIIIKTSLQMRARPTDERTASPRHWQILDQSALAGAHPHAPIPVRRMMRAPTFIHLCIYTVFVCEISYIAPKCDKVRVCTHTHNRPSSTTTHRTLATYMWAKCIRTLAPNGCQTNL